LLPSTGGRGVGRLGQQHLHPGGLQALGHIPPPGTRLNRETNPINPGKALQPLAQVLTISRNDPPTHHLSARLIEVVERQLLPMDIQSAYDRHHGPPHAPWYMLLNAPLSVRLS